VCVYDDFAAWRFVRRFLNRAWERSPPFRGEGEEAVAKPIISPPRRSAPESSIDLFTDVSFPFSRGNGDFIATLGVTFLRRGNRRGRVRECRPMRPRFRDLTTPFVPGECKRPFTSDYARGKKRREPQRSQRANGTTSDAHCVRRSSPKVDSRKGGKEIEKFWLPDARFDKSIHSIRSSFASGISGPFKFRLVLVSSTWRISAC